jgi:hypothetical protein
MSLSNERIATYSGKYRDWAENNNYFITTNSNNSIYFWNTINYTITKILTYNEKISQISISPDNLLLAITDLNNFSIIDSSQDNLSLWAIPRKNFISSSWSPNGKSIQIFETDPKLISGCNLTIRDGKNGSILNYLYVPSTFYSRQFPFSQLIFSTFGKYAVNDISNSTLKIYNLSEVERIMKNSGGENIYVVWSWDRTTMLICDKLKGIIEVRNASTGDLINILETPMYIYTKSFSPHPFFIYFIFPAIGVLLFFIILLIVYKYYHYYKNKE